MNLFPPGGFEDYFVSRSIYEVLRGHICETNRHVPSFAGKSILDLSKT